MIKLSFVLVMLPAFSFAEVVPFNIEIWNEEKCAPMTESFKKDPYLYLVYITKTLDAAKTAIVYGANRGLIPEWNEKFWDIIGRSDELSGFVQTWMRFVGFSVGKILHGSFNHGNSMGIRKEFGVYF